jgi:hypothetical protein
MAHVENHCTRVVTEMLELWDYTCPINPTYIPQMQAYEYQFLQRNIITDRIIETTSQNICTIVNNKTCDPSGLSGVTI